MHQNEVEVEWVERHVVVRYFGKNEDLAFFSRYEELYRQRALLYLGVCRQTGNFFK